VLLVGAIGRVKLLETPDEEGFGGGICLSAMSAGAASILQPAALVFARRSNSSHQEAALR
jgi:hypothetical protein